MLPVSALETIRPLFITPCYGANVTTVFVRSWTHLCMKLFQAGVAFDMFFADGESLITRARNQAVAQFLANGDFTHVFWIDADIGFTPEAAFRILLADRDVAAGVYPLKREVWPEQGLPAGAQRSDLEKMATRYPVNTGTSDPEILLEVADDGFMPIGEAPTGFMAIKRGVFRRLIEAYPDLKLTWDGPPGHPFDPYYYAFFDVMTHPVTRRYLSEDYAFCERWRAIGGVIHIDTKSDLTHQGFHLYRGNFEESLNHNIALTIGGPVGQKMIVKRATPA
jgi:hypothetical protein